MNPIVINTAYMETEKKSRTTKPLAFGDYAVLILLQYADAPMCVHKAVEFLHLLHLQIDVCAMSTAVPIATVVQLRVDLVLSR